MGEVRETPRIPRTGVGLRTGRNGDLIAALDIGCAKIGCLIARVAEHDTDGESLSLIGAGHQSSRGFEAGAITDLDALERAVRLTVEDAEKQAGQTVSDVVVAISAPQVAARLVRGEISTGGREVTPRDVRKVLAEAMARFWTTPEAQAGGIEVLASTPVAFAIAGTDGVRDPVGLATPTLGVIVNVVYAPSSVIRNLRQCLGRAHLAVAAFVPSATASALGTLIADERDHGAICIDMGAGITTACVFLNGVPAWLARVPVGGAHVTRDIAQGLGTTMAAAERVKTVQGQALTDVGSAGEWIACPLLGDDGRLAAGRVSRKDLAGVIVPRLEESFELVGRQLDASPLRVVMPRRIVLTGGASQLPGVREVAQRVLRRPVRMARPVQAEKLGETYASAAFSTAAGLLMYAMAGLPDAGRGGAGSGTGGVQDGKGLWSRTLGWLGENF
jgi:cell division protein FtsA